MQTKKKKRRLKRKVKIFLGGFACLAIVLCMVLFISRFLKDPEEALPAPEVETIATLCIDPGHGGYDSGTIGSEGAMEKDINLEIALQIGKQITKKEPRIKVVYTRTSDEVTWPEEEVKDLEARVKFAEEQNADYYLSVHMNSNNSPSVYGYEFYIKENDSFSRAVTRKIVKNLDEAEWHYHRGTMNVEEYPLYVVTESKIPAMLFEAGFMSNYSECTELQQTKNQKIIAKGVAQAYIDQILKDKLPDEDKETKKEEE